MFARLRSTYLEIAEATAGERFQFYHRRRKGRSGRWHTAAITGAGVLLVVLGLLLSLPPLLPGFLLWLPGLALVATQSGGVARVLDRSECLLRRLYRRVAARVATR
jgi:hypothetical protein